MTAPSNTVTSTATLNGQVIYPISWHCQLGAYGNINHFELTTSIKALQDPSLVQSSPTSGNTGNSTAPFDIFASVKKNFNSRIQIYAKLDGVQTPVFAGIVDEIEALWHDDIIEIRGRDSSAILRDEFQAPSDINYNNQPISQIVTQYAQKYGFTPLVTPTTMMAGTQFDSYQSQEYNYADRPRPLWRSLQILAQQVGYIMFVTPRNELFFGKPGTGAMHTYYWKPSPANVYNKSQLPVHTLTAIQQSRRCNNFTVNVYAVDHNNNNQRAFATTVVYNGTASSGQAASKNAIAAGSGFVYNRHPFGLTPENAQQTADAIAEEIQRRELVFQATVDGDPTVNVNDKVTFLASTAGDLFSLNNQRLVIAGLTHTFEMPHYEATDGAGFWTNITATGSIQPENE